MLTREELYKSCYNCVPKMGWDAKYPETYGKYGITISGVYDGWRWFTEDSITDYARECGHKPLSDATNEELYEMWAMADHYWLGEYKEWLNNSRKKSEKLDQFIGYCERNYFGCDDRYTDKTIERILTNIKFVLDTLNEKGKIKNNDWFH